MIVRPAYSCSQRGVGRRYSSLLRHSLAVCLALLAASPILTVGTIASADPEWQSVRSTSDGIVVSRRPGRTSGFYELRFEARSLLPPDRFEASVWESFQVARPPVRRRDFLVRQPDEIVFHDQIKVAVVSDREYTMRIVRERQGEVLRLSFGTRPELGPPPADGYVTIPIVRGTWEFHQEGSGTAVVYTLYSEPGGSVPAFLVRAAQQDEALEDVRHALKDASR